MVYLRNIPFFISPDKTDSNLQVSSPRVKRCEVPSCYLVSSLNENKAKQLCRRSPLATVLYPFSKVCIHHAITRVKIGLAVDGIGRTDKGHRLSIGLRLEMWDWISPYHSNLSGLSLVPPNVCSVLRFTLAGIWSTCELV